MVLSNGFPRKRSDAQLFKRARQLTRWHYQWLVVNDFLKTTTFAGIADKILFGRPKHYASRNNEPYMPLEFSVAAYRFGHTMVRAAWEPVSPESKKSPRDSRSAFDDSDEEELGVPLFESRPVPIDGFPARRFTTLSPFFWRLSKVENIEKVKLTARHPLRAGEDGADI